MYQKLMFSLYLAPLMAAAGTIPARADVIAGPDPGSGTIPGIWIGLALTALAVVIYLLVRALRRK